jgi:hypothetical protein
MNQLSCGIICLFVLFLAKSIENQSSENDNTHKTRILCRKMLHILSKNGLQVEQTVLNPTGLSATVSRHGLMKLRGGRPTEDSIFAFVGGDGKTVANVNTDGEVVGSTVPWIDALIKKKQTVRLHSE